MVTCHAGGRDALTACYALVVSDNEFRIGRVSRRVPDWAGAGRQRESQGWAR
jgi:hypothetical protein